VATSRKRQPKETNAVGRARREYSEIGAKARTFVAQFAASATPQEIASRLYNNQHPKPLEYFLELWRDQHITIPTPTIVEVVRHYDRLLSHRTKGD